MEIKKSPKADLERGKGLSLLMGFVVGLAVLFVSFEWTSTEVTVATEKDQVQDIIAEEEIEITRPENTPPPPPPPAAPVVAEELNIVEDDVELEQQEIVSSEDDATAAQQETFVAAPVVEEEEEDNGDEADSNNADAANNDNANTNGDANNDPDDDDDHDMDSHDQIDTANSEPPQLNLSIASVTPYSVVLNIGIVNPTYVWCTARLATDAAPSVYDLLAIPQHYFSASGSWEINGLNARTSYKAYCYAENEYGVAMKPTIEEIAQTFTTEEGRKARRR